MKKKFIFDNEKIALFLCRSDLYKNMRDINSCFHRQDSRLINPYNFVIMTYYIA